MSEEDYKIAYENVMIANKMLEENNKLLIKQKEQLQEDLEYSNYCNEELRKKITNLNYKIKLLEEDNTGERALYHSEREVKEDYKTVIKEVREYIKENSIYYPTSDGCQWVDQFKVLEILDKINNETLD